MNKILFARVSNPLRPDHPTPEEITWVSGTSFTFRDLLKRKYGEEFVEYATPMVVLRNTEALMRAQWGDDLQHGDVIVEMPIITGIETIIIAAIVVVAVVAAVVVAATMKMPNMAGVTNGGGVGSSLGEASTLYNLGGASNQPKLGSPIEVAYGRNRLYPAYACPWYNRYSYNQQYLYALYCLGQGEYDIERILIGDTDATNFPEANITVVPPNTPVGVVWPRVRTAPEVASIELKAPNEVDFPGGTVNAVNPDDGPALFMHPNPGLGPEGGWFGTFAVNPYGTKCYRIECDVTLPGGLYYYPPQQDPVPDGGYPDGEDPSIAEPGHVILEFQYRAVNPDGTKGSWLHLYTFDYSPERNEAGLYAPGSGGMIPDPTVSSVEFLHLDESAEGTPGSGVILGWGVNTPFVEFTAHTGKFVVALAASSCPMLGVVRVYDTSDTLVSPDAFGRYSVAADTPLKCQITYWKPPGTGSSLDQATVQVTHKV